MGILTKAAKAAKAAARAAGKARKTVLAEKELAAKNKAKAKDKAKAKAKPKGVIGITLAAGKKKAKAKESPNKKYVGSGPISEVVEGKKPGSSSKKGKASVSEAEKKDQAKKATGRITAKNTKPGAKPLSMSKYRSFTDAQRAKAKAQAGIDFRAGKITKAERDTIVKRIDAANAAEVDKGGRKMAQGKANKKEFKGYTPKSPFNKGGMPMVKKDGKSIPAFAADGVGKMMAGGMAKKKAKK
tara:strand:- start:39 stop:764 length:726 start_codon:yes stop_codon:yes gene_type:complete